MHGDYSILFKVFSWQTPLAFVLAVLSGFDWRQTLRIARGVDGHHFHETGWLAARFFVAVRGADTTDGHVHPKPWAVHAYFALCFAIGLVVHRYFWGHSLLMVLDAALAAQQAFYVARNWRRGLGLF